MIGYLAQNETDTFIVERVLTSGGALSIWGVSSNQVG